MPSIDLILHLLNCLGVNKPYHRENICCVDTSYESVWRPERVPLANA